MCNQNEWIVREAFLAYDRGDVTRMMDFVDPDVDWTYLDSGPEGPRPRICRGRGSWRRRCAARPTWGCGPSSRRSSPPGTG